MANKKLFGEAEVRANGALLLTLPGATLDPGGVSRTPIEGATEIHGFASKPRPSKLECETSLRKGDSVTDVLAIEDGTITFRAKDTGQVWVIRNAWCDGENTITAGSDGGKVKYVFQGPAAEEILA